MNIIFFGSDDFALVHLEKLVHSSNRVLACVTQPDRPKGRGMQVISSAIKLFAQEHKIDILQPTDLQDAQWVSRLKSYNSDLFVVVAYGRILSIEVLSIPYLCCMNVHGSLLPKYRGAAPINWAIMNGEQETGASIIKMNSTMDAGDIFAQVKIPIDCGDTSITLRSKMSYVAADLLLKVIGSLENNAYTLTGQDRTQVTFAPKLNKELGLIDWNQAAVSIHNRVRGLLPWPAAYTFFQGKMLKLLETQVLLTAVKQSPPGEIMEINSEGFVVATKDHGLWVRQVHLDSSKMMDARSFVLGHKLLVGFRF